MKVSVHYWEAVWERSWIELEVPEEVSVSAIEIDEWLEDTINDWIAEATHENVMVVEGIDTTLDWEEVK